MIVDNEHLLSGMTVTVNREYLESRFEVDCATEVFSSLGFWIIVQVNLGSVDSLLTASI